MDNMMFIVIGALVGLAIVGGIVYYILKSAANKKNRMMTIIRGEHFDDSSGKKSLKNSRRDALAKKLKESKKLEKEEQKDKPGIGIKLMQAGLQKVTVSQFWLFSLACGVVCPLIMMIMGKGALFVILAAIIGFFGLPRYILNKIIKKRQKKFLSELADALEAMTRLLRAGMPVSEAIKMVGREYTGPIGEEMERIFEQQKIGVSLPEAVQECAKRIPLPEVQMFATAVTIQAQTGSSLSEILEGLAKVIRARFRLRRKVQALSSEAKSSAMIIGALPVFVATAMYFINPDYIGVLFYDTTGKWLLGFAIFWMTCGVLVMKQMINFKV